MLHQSEENLDLRGTKMKIRKIIFYLLAVILGGCVPVMSLHPLYTEKDIIFEDKLLGTWIEDNNDTTWEFERFVQDPNHNFELVAKPPLELNKTYLLIFTSNKEKEKGSFFAHLVELNGKRFLDVYPSEYPLGVKDPNKFYIYNAFFTVPLHSFISVDSIGSELKLRLTEDLKMATLLEETPNVLEHTFVGDRLIITASTQRLQQFMTKYADNENVFCDEVILKRMGAVKPDKPKAAEPNEPKMAAPDANSIKDK